MSERTMVLMSGGMDSAVVLAMAKDRRDGVRALFINYGQHGAMYEWASAARLCDYYEVSKLYIDIGKPFAPSLLVDIHDVPGSKEALARFGWACKLPGTFVPSRNLTLIAIASSWAWAYGDREIAGGWNAVDTDYPDCSGQFLQWAQYAFCRGLGYHTPVMGIWAPLLEYSKAEIAHKGMELGVPFEYTRSCYRNQWSPCMKCDSCLKRAMAFHHWNERDPLIEEDRWNNFIDSVKED